MSLDNSATKIRKEPPVVLDEAHLDRLQSLATAAAERSPEVSERLLHEIDRADIRPSAKIPPGVVNIGSLVSFREEATGKEQTVTLVLPHDADIAQQRVSVLTPIGAALIGLAQGASITWETRSGETRRLTITTVEAPAAPER